MTIPMNKECSKSPRSLTSNVEYKFSNIWKGGVLSISFSKFLSHWVTRNGFPIGLHPCATMVSTFASPVMASPIAPSFIRSSFKYKTFSPGPRPPEEIPPIVVLFGKA